MKDSFVFYRSFFEAIEEADKDSQLAIYRAIAKYALDMEELPLDGVAKILWKLIKPQLDANWRRFENGRKGGAYGNKGGAPKGNQNARKTTPKQPLNNSKTTPNVNDNVNGNDNDNDNDNVPSKESVSGKSTRFIPPSLQDVQNYISEKGYNIDANKFIDFYSSKGWMVGRSKMKDWKASVRTWASRENRPPQTEIGVILKDNSPDKYKKEDGW